ncbi:MAG: ACR protein [Cycloclasticus sp.]|nr:ACR protein [Cycloclasticus sp.]MBG96527.1 ACR protein [Cycloclasticus sp.]|tara:strand:- start:1315 stop:2544 length:1230 start_codon:yes stop_codon:yes gene_type:complete
MGIRAISFFTQLPTHPSLQQMRQHFAPIGQQAAQVQSLFTKAGYDIQSLRLATQPLEQLLPKGATSQQLATFAQQFEQAASEAGFKHMALGTLGASIKTPADENKNDVIQQLMCGLPAVIDATDWVFTSVQLADQMTGFKADMLPMAAQIVLENAPMKEDGFGNLRYCMVANMKAFSPFFPAALHDGSSSPAFSIAIESADKLVDLLETAGKEASRCSMSSTFTRYFNTLGAELDGLAAKAAECTHLEYRGIDMTPSPYPTIPRSLGRIVELLNNDSFGGPGTIAAIALIKQSLDAAEFTRAGYCGVMLLPLEDAVLAEGAKNQDYDISTLLACSAVGATGLDVIPVSGNITRQKIEGLMRDIAQLATTLNKPLTVRLLPVPEQQAGELTQFNFDYFAKTRIFNLPSDK